ncbi:chemotaxis protein CheW [Prosthecobacter sp. SYSU 5D2]|uniref:chemotaxis protein CheW n=1 Tax=Prosthecobacter sp. SYSU 5D2 TaxID=3134134 RepID=UPI0031FEB76D
MLTFSIGGVSLGLDASHVQEVIPSVRLVTPPEIPPLVRGFVTFHGGLIPVIRLEKLLDGGAEPSSPAMKLSDRIIIARLGGTQVAWLAGAQMEPLSYRTRDVAELPEDHVLNNCAFGVLQHTPPVILLEPDKLLLASEIRRLAELRQRAASRMAMLEMETA